MKEKSEYMVISKIDKVVLKYWFDTDVNFSFCFRAEYNEHIETHWPKIKCDQCETLVTSYVKYETHLKEAHNMTLSADLHQYADFKAPKVNAQGKTKTQRCKHCDFVSITKESYWYHCRTHIDPDKWLTCPRCPFVTELKHHFEYHIKNHANLKPFKCDQCDYVCVNKSMLNSHLKSHSEVFQYSCRDCSYLTKYCHTFKLHLRVNNHSPAVVLFPDGTPNPNPTIDIYGTRRGPKQRPRTAPKPSTTKRKVSRPTPFQNLNSYNSIATSSEVALSYPYPYDLSGYPNVFPVNNNSQIVPAFPQNVDPYSSNKRDTPNSSENNHYYYMTNNNIHGFAVGDRTMKEKLLHIQENSYLNTDRDNLKRENLEKAELGAPLDLSKHEVVNSEEQNNVTPSKNTSSAMLSVQKTQVKNRRKGPAFKIEHISWKLQQQISNQGTENLSPATESFTGNRTSPSNVADRNTNGNGVTSPLPDKTIVDEDMTVVDSEKKKGFEISALELKDYYCKYCEIAFKDSALYTIHMGQHSSQDPFQCSMCGKKTDNKVEFSLHIATQSHV